MGAVLHDSATTTKAVRRALQRRQASVRAAAKRDGVIPTAMQTWRDRETTSDAATRPKEPRSTVLTPEEERSSSPSTEPRSSPLQSVRQKPITTPHRTSYMRWSRSCRTRSTQLRAWATKFEMRAVLHAAGGRTASRASAFKTKNVAWRLVILRRGAVGVSSARQPPLTRFSERTLPWRRPRSCGWRAQQP